MDPSEKFEAMELVRMVKACQKIAGETNMEDLVTRMMNLFLANSGAERGIFFVEKEGQPSVEAVGVLEDEQVQVWHTQHLGELEFKGLPHIYPHSIVDFVWHTGENVILPDVKGNFTEDEYITQNNPQSILCIPSMYQGRKVGLLYLENNLFKAAFTPDRVQVLSFLASHMAIFIENNRIRNHLENIVEKRTEELKEVNDMLHVEVAERRSAQAKLELSEEKFSKAFRHSPNLMAISSIEDGRFIDVNDSFCRVLGYTRDEVIGKTSMELGIWADIDDRRIFIENLKEYKEVRDQEVRIRKKDGQVCISLFSGVSIPLFGSNHLLSIATDISGRKELEEQLKEAAVTDELTGLYNRRGFFTLAEQQCKIANRKKTAISVLYMDLDNLKMINDRFGHLEGDKALTAVGSILKNSFRESDIIARIGGDEFAVLLVNHRGRDIETLVSNNVKQRLESFNTRGGTGFTLSLSMGFAHYDGTSHCTVGELISQADEAMYKEKKVTKSSGSLPVLTREENFERRKSDRYTIKSKFPAKLGSQSDFFVKNIGSGGLCLVSGRQIPEKKVYRLAISPPGTPAITLEGEVIWSSRHDATREKRKKGDLYEFGVKFVSSKDKIDAPLKKLLSGARKVG